MRIVILALFCFSLRLSAQIAEPTVQIAVISDADSKDLAALVATDLSGYSGVELIERDELNRIGDELKLQKMAGTDAVALGKIIHADGLLFISKGTDHFQVRFTAVSLGYALFDDQTTPKTDEVFLAKTISRRAAGYVSKLWLNPAKAIPISVLNLRTDLSSPEAFQLEREITVLLESRLASIPEYVVLERRHSSALQFERTLSVPRTFELIKGMQLIDGSIQLANPGHDEIAASLRIRSTGPSQDSTFGIHGSKTDLQGFVEALVKKITEQIGIPTSSAPWTPKDEAREYLKEGIWGWQHNNPKVALEALDSAAMLGEEASDLLAIRIQVLSQLASQEPYFFGGKNIQPAFVPVQERLDYIHRALADLKIYSDDQGESKLILFNTNNDPAVRTGDARGAVIQQAFNLLFELDEVKDNPLGHSLREELRVLSGFDPYHNKIPGLAADKADALAVSLDEELTYWRLKSDGSAKWLPSIYPKNFCLRFLKTADQQKAAYDQFIRELLADPKGKLFGLLLLSKDPDITVQEKNYSLFVEELWNRREELLTSNRLYTYTYSAHSLPEDLRKKYTGLTIPLLRYYLAKTPEIGGQFNEYIFQYLWQPQWFPPDDATAIWKDYQKGKDREAAKTGGKLSERTLNAADRYETKFLTVFSQIEEAPKTTSEPPPITVDQFWSPSEKPGQSPDKFYLFDLVESEDGVWALGGPNEPEKIGIYQVKLPGMETNFLPTECGPRPYNVVKASGSIYVTYGEYPAGDRPIQIFLKRYDPATKTWQTRQIADITAGSLYVVKDQIYFDLWTSVGRTQEGGLARYDWATDSLVILSSSRRRPALNQFDDREGYQTHGLFLGPGDKLCVNADGGINYVLEQSGTWPTVFDFPLWVKPTTQGRQTLVVSNGGEVVLLDADRDQPLPLLVPSEPRDWRLTPDKKRKKELPVWAAQALWKLPSRLERSRVFESPDCVGFHEGHLYVLSSPGKNQKNFELTWFTQGQSDPIRIPLRFVINSSEEEAVKGFIFPPRPGENNNGLLRMLTTKEGICFNGMRGFWFLPFSGVEAYLKSISK